MLDSSEQGMKPCRTIRKCWVHIPQWYIYRQNFLYFRVYPTEHNIEPLRALPPTRLFFFFLVRCMSSFSPGCCSHRCVRTCVDLQDVWHFDRPVGDAPPGPQGTSEFQRDFDCRFVVVCVCFFNVGKVVILGSRETPHNFLVSRL